MWNIVGYIIKGDIEVQQNSKNLMEDNPKKLIAVVIALSIFVVTLFGFAPSV